MQTITLKTIPHKNHRYPDCGDWYFKKGKVSKIEVSDTGNEDYEFLITIHELIESYLCSKRGITEKAVNKFDMKYVECRAFNLPLPCGCKIQDEAGMDKHAPYRKEHQFATSIEKQLSTALGVNWIKYEKTIESL